MMARGCCSRIVALPMPPAQLSSLLAWGTGSERTPHLLLLCWIDISVRSTKYWAVGLAHVPRAAERCELARAGLLNLLLYLGWLRSSETFTTPWAAFDVVDPCDAATVNLPVNAGQACLSLRAETKSARDHTADVVMANQTLSGYCRGRWVHRLRSACGLGRDWQSSPRLVFIYEEGSPWTSLYFRHTYPYPTLETQRSLAIHISHRSTVDPVTAFRASAGLFTAIVEPHESRYRSLVKGAIKRPRLLRCTSTLAGAANAVARTSM
jgi:hypothetical protein